MQADAPQPICIVCDAEHIASLLPSGDRVHVKLHPRRQPNVVKSRSQQHAFDILKSEPQVQLPWSCTIGLGLVPFLDLPAAVLISRQAIIGKNDLPQWLQYSMHLP